jgi:hypothetical protein
LALNGAAFVLAHAPELAVLNDAVARGELVPQSYLTMAFLHPCGNRQSFCDPVQAGQSATSPQRCAQLQRLIRSLPKSRRNHCRVFTRPIPIPAMLIVSDDQIEPIVPIIRMTLPQDLPAIAGPMVDVKFEYHLPSKMVRGNADIRRAAASLLRQHPRNLRIAEGILTVEDPFVRSVIIRTVREAVFAKPMPKVVKSNPDIWILEARQ